MPIRPEMRDRYPADWPEISLRIRQQRAGNRCECLGECGHDHAGRCPELNGADHSITGSKVVLTVAHLDDVPEHNADANLRAMCQRCHLSYDRPIHVFQLRMTISERRLARARNGELFVGELGRRPRPERPARPPALTHYWRVRTTLPDRYRAPCRILANGRLNSVLIEFADGVRHVVSRWAVRRLG